MQSPVVILSVDWEPDKGPWKWRGIEMDYGGILCGTPAFCALLDDLRIPCTWFIETSSEPSRNLPTRFADVVRQLARRDQDEIGLHIHWRRRMEDHSFVYETIDPAWVGAQLEHGVQQLNSLDLRPRAFRSGALLHIPHLPRMLDENGFTVDSSTLWGRANRLQSDKKRLQPKRLLSRVATLTHRLVGGVPDAYFPMDSDVEQPGGAATVEFPITYSLFDSSTFRRGLLCHYVKLKALMAKKTRYLTLFFHIDEVTRIGTGPDEKAEADMAIIHHFRTHLAGLKRTGARFLTCSEAREHWLRHSARASQRHLSSSTTQ